MNDMVKIAAVQTDPGIMKNDENLDGILKQAKTAAGNGAELIVFPECALTGYVFNSREEALPFMETVPGPATDRIGDFCREVGVHVVIGLLEKDGNRCFNTAVLICPQGLVGKYRKVHLPFLGIDRFVDPGDKPFEVHKTPIGNIGLHICYDCNFPESGRVMTLLGADILVLPTNWPMTRGTIADHVIKTRAFENKVNLVAVDRVGEERGTMFMGRSQIIDAWGQTLTEGSETDEEILYGEVSLELARQKHIVIKAGEFEVDYIKDRRPEMYGEITKL